MVLTSPTGRPPRLALVKPSLGERRGKPYRTPAVLEPLVFALLAGATPAGFEVRFLDERLEDIPFDGGFDLVALSVETYTARRAWQIAREFRARGVPVVAGGFHPTLLPAEAAEHVDSVAIGEVEAIWPRLLA
ncbi:MAG: B12-binding domain-containing radical SAM protein, partial [Candidatus Riflebacteria bacterium]|nr:B12-binding domain-containing radical SAM protein [Candidatus Riflebacteria bacterium]